MDDLARQLFEIDLHGFTVVECVLSRDEVAAVRAVNERLLGEHDEDMDFNGRAGHVSNLPRYDPVYLPLIDHPKVLPILEAAMGRDLILGSLNTRVVRPGDGEQKLHADIPDRLRRDGPPVMMNTVWMLDDFTEEMGATRIVPGSHRMATRHPPEGLEPAIVYQAVAPAGSVLIFNGQCWHAGGANRTDRNRHALFGHYRIDEWMRFQCDPHAGFPQAMFDALNQRQKELLRMTRGLGHAHAADYGDEDL